MNKLALASIAVVGPSAAAVLAEPIAGQSHSATLDGNLKIHYTSYGTAEPTLVFIHGWACDESVWNAQASELGKKIRCITIDLPGHGQSDKPDLPYNMHLYARAIDAVMRDAQIPSAVLVGHSNGTPVIRQFYREYLPKVRALVIVDGALRPLADAATMQKFIAPFRGPDYQSLAGKFVDGLTVSIKDKALRDRIKATILRTPQNVSVSELESTVDPELWKPDPIEVPVLMIMAKQPAWTSDYEKFVRNLAPHLDYQMWENVSHFIMMEKPREFNDALITFLQTNRFLPQASKEA
jgi:pimeloyl-ACP methyl ester carboxylesterase